MKQAIRSAWKFVPSAPGLARYAVLCSAFYAFFLAGALYGQGPVMIDFEAFPGPDGILGTIDDIPAPDCPDDICDLLGLEYASLGLTFNSGALFQGVLFPESTAADHYVSSSPLDVTLDFDAYEVSISSYSFWSATLYALDVQGNLVTLTALPNTTGDFLFGTINLESSEPFRRVAVLAEGCQVGQLCAQILNVDDLTIYPYRNILTDGFESGDTAAWDSTIGSQP